MEELSVSLPDWANITNYVLRSIADKTHSVKDVVRMTAACRSWQASLVDKKINFPVCLKLAETEDSDKRCFYSTSKEMFELDLPEIRGRRCWGSPFGWLVTCGIDLEIRLFNPLTRASLPLPSLRTFHDYDNEEWIDRPPEEYLKYYLRKLILTSSAEASESDCIVLAQYSRYFFAFAKPGDKTWSRIDNVQAQDAIYFKGNLYVSQNNGEIFVCEDLYGAHPIAVQFAPSPPHDFDRVYLFDLAGNLCLVARGVLPDDDDNYDDPVETIEFKIFKLDMHTKSWEEIFSLGDKCLFLGNCCTFVVPAADYPGCRSNCIYFTDDIFEYYDKETGATDIGIYDCKNIKLDIIKRYEDGEEVGMYLEGLVDRFPNSEDIQHLLLSPLFQPLWIIPYSLT
ncbi:hypothetical protein V6N13_055785 [Hibiscus sabdariffa]|uniref:KIB1-4 beta-propeller domain-containing protein n=1 Tax=Hibiscus sabdariffa TaxID=183260 RepID=A0ABR2BMG1_9ROSI